MFDSAVRKGDYILTPIVAGQGANGTKTGVFDGFIEQIDGRIFKRWGSLVPAMPVGSSEKLK